MLGREISVVMVSGEVLAEVLRLLAPEQLADGVLYILSLAAGSGVVQQLAQQIPG